MRSRAKIFTKNGSKGCLKAAVQKYSQEMAGKHCFREVMQKYSCPATHRGRIRAVEPDFKKSNTKSDAQGACIRLLHSKGCC